MDEFKLHPRFVLIPVLALIFCASTANATVEKREKNNQPVRFGIGMRDTTPRYVKPYWQGKKCPACLNAIADYNALVDDYNKISQKGVNALNSEDFYHGRVVEDNQDIELINKQPFSDGKEHLLNEANEKLKNHETKIAEYKNEFKKLQGEAVKLNEKIADSKSKIEDCLKGCQSPSSISEYVPKKVVTHEVKPNLFNHWAGSTCPACSKELDNYNNSVDTYNQVAKQVADAQTTLDTDNQVVGNDKDYIDFIKSLPESDENFKELVKAQQQSFHDNQKLNYDADQLKKIENDLTSANNKKSASLKDLENCLKHCEHASLIKPVKSAEESYVAFSRTTTEIGIIGGVSATDSNATVTATGSDFTAPDPRFSHSSSSTNGEIGAQIREIFDLKGIVQPFIFANVLTTFNSTSNTNFGALLPGAGTSKLVTDNNWIARVGAGVQTEPLNYHIQVGAGIGAAVIGQRLTATISEPGLTSTFQNTMTTVQPTFMTNVSWQFCQSCVGGHAASLAAQISVDRYPEQNASGTTAFANNYANSVSIHWVPHVDMVLSVQLPN